MRLPCYPKHNRILHHAKKKSNNNNNNNTHHVVLCAVWFIVREYPVAVFVRSDPIFRTMKKRKKKLGTRSLFRCSEPMYARFFFLSFINFTVILQCCHRTKTVCVGGCSRVLRFECKQIQTRSLVRFSKSKKKKE